MRKIIVTTGSMQLLLVLFSFLSNAAYSSDTAQAYIENNSNYYIQAGVEFFELNVPLVFARHYHHFYIYSQNRDAITFYPHRVTGNIYVEAKATNGTMYRCNHGEGDVFYQRVAVYVENSSDANTGIKCTYDFRDPVEKPGS